MRRRNERLQRRLIDPDEMNFWLEGFAKEMPARGRDR
jgi:hypothetical protein